MPSWLKNQRKATLLDLSAEAGLQHDPDARRDEILHELDDYLQANQTRLSSNPAFDPYYGSRTARARTPGRPPRTSSMGGAITSGDDAEVKSVVRGRGRRTTQVKQELDALGDHHAALSSPSQTLATSSSALTGRAPTEVARRQSRRRSSLPPSPALVTDEIEHQEAKIYAGLVDLYTVSGVPDFVDWLRDTCSSVIAVQATFLLLEAYAIQSAVLPWRYTGFDFPSLTFPILGLGTPSIAIKVPNMFILLTSFFWSTSLLWAATSMVIPAIFSYFYNLTTRTVRRHGVVVNVVRYEYDPFVFNIVKALLTWTIYGQGFYYGIVDYEVADRVDRATYGGYQGILIGCYVCIVASLYEAAQRK